MNEQEIFDFVVNHIRKQGGPALNNLSCAYRTEDGLKCAAGCLIADEVYAVYGKDIEGEIVTNYRVAMALKNSGIDVDDRLKLRLITELQGAHDSLSTGPVIINFVEKFEKKAKSIANDLGLIYTKP